MGMMKITPNSEVRSAGFGFSDAIFNQMRMINELEVEVFKSAPVQRQGFILAAFQAIRGLETMIWGKIEKSKTYAEAKEKIKLDFDALHENGIPGQLKFMDGLDEWKKLLMLYLRAFDFYPASSVDYIAGVGIRKRG